MQQNREDDSIFGRFNEIIITEELFRQEYHPEINGHFIYKGQAVVEPLVWSKIFGKGKVLGISLSYSSETFRNVSFQK